MLIASHRYTAADLVAWSELDRQDARLASSPVLSEHVRKSQSAISLFSNDGPCFVSVSWGKDSIVVAHLAATALDRPRLIWFPAGSIENPDCTIVRDAFLSRFGHLVRYEEREAGLASDEWDRTIGHDGAQGAFERASKEAGGRYICGVRAEESGTRKLSMRVHGESTGRSCRPIGWWGHEHVFAYLHRHDLPIHPAYACLMGGALDRHRIRVGTIGGQGGASHGRREWERRYYPEVIRDQSHEPGPRALPAAPAEEENGNE